MKYIILYTIDDSGVELYYTHDEGSLTREINNARLFPDSWISEIRSVKYLIKKKKNIDLRTETVVVENIRKIID